MTCNPFTIISCVVAVSCSSTTNNPQYLPIFSRDVLKCIAAGDESWDEMVPPQVAEIIATAVSSDTRKVKGVLSHSTVN